MLADEKSKSKTMVIILSAPSGGGKSSIARALISKDPKLVLSISATTRPPRPNEEDAIHYFFQSSAEFERMIQADELIEYAKIYDRYYGIPKKFIEEKLNQNFDLLLDINFEGAQKIKQLLGKRVVSIFIKPPSLEDLRQRIIARGQDTPEAIERRIHQAKAETENAKYYDYVITNRNFDTTVREIQAIIDKERTMRR